MEDLLGDLVDETDGPTLTRLLSQFRQGVAELRAEVAGLRRENLELRQQAGYWKGTHAQACRRIAELEQEVEHVRGENRKLQARAFGRKSEKQCCSDCSNQLDDPGETKPQRPRGQQRSRPGPKRRDYSHLPVREAMDMVADGSHHRCPNSGRAPARSLAAPPQPLKMRSALGTRTTLETRLLCHQPPQRTDYKILICMIREKPFERHLTIEAFDEHRLERTRENSVPIGAGNKPPEDGPARTRYNHHRLLVAALPACRETARGWPDLSVPLSAALVDRDSKSVQPWT